MKYRLARVRTHRMMGDYLDALESLSNIETELVTQMDKYEEGSKQR